VSREVVTLQAMVSGRISDAITTGAPRSTPGVRLVHEGDARPVEGASVRVRDDGLYAIFGDPLRLPSGQDLALRLNVSAEGYATTSLGVALTAADTTLTLRIFPLRGADTAAFVLADPARNADIALSPLPVHLGGRVTRAEDGAPIAGAAVEITAPTSVGPDVTDANGFFTLGPAPVAESVTLQISAAGRETLSPEVRLDYRNPVNPGAYVLEPS
jgi:hypothetical protein